MTKKEFLFRIPSKKLAWDFLTYLDLVATRAEDPIGFNFNATPARDSLYKQLCISEGKNLGWPSEKIAETFPNKKLKRKYIEKLFKKY